MHGRLHETGALKSPRRSCRYAINGENAVHEFLRSGVLRIEVHAFDLEKVFASAAEDDVSMAVKDAEKVNSSALLP